MSDDEHHGHDVHFESADAGASLTYPQQAGTVRKNGFLVIKGRPCKASHEKIGFLLTFASLTIPHLAVPATGCRRLNVKDWQARTRQVPFRCH